MGVLQQILEKYVVHAEAGGEQMWYNILIIVICLIIYPCNGNTSTSEYVFFDMKYIKGIDKLLYVSGGGMETIEINMNNNSDYVYIHCMPLTKAEYYENSRICKIDYLIERHAGSMMEIEIDNRRIVGERKDYENEQCSIQCVDFMAGVTLSITYYGKKNNIDMFLDLTKSIKYHIRQHDLVRFKNRQIDIAQYINKLDVPVYRNVSNKKVTICLKGLIKRVEYEVSSSENPLDVLEQYIKYFRMIKWVPRKISDFTSVNLESGSIHYSWKDPQNELGADFLMLSNPEGKDGSRTMYMVYIDISTIMAGD